MLSRNTIKLVMALLDLLLTNTEQHYYIAGHEKDQNLRYEFRNELAIFVIRTDWGSCNEGGHVPTEELFHWPTMMQQLPTPLTVPMKDSNTRQRLIKTLLFANSMALEYCEAG